jgi:hypothetical protein
MEKILTDDTLTAEQAMLVARKLGRRGAAKQSAPSTAKGGDGLLHPDAAGASGMTGQAIERVAAMARGVGEQGAQAGEYLTRSISGYPLTALLMAGVLGYATAYLIHASRQTTP